METDLHFAGTEEADRIKALLLKQLRQTITTDEQEQLNNWIAAHPLYKQVYERVNNEELLLTDLLQMKQLDMAGWWQKITAQTGIVYKRQSFFSRHRVYAAVALLLLITTAICLYWLFSTPHPKKDAGNTPPMAHVKPGGNVATLTLSNGQVINLGNTANGTLADLGDAQVVKLKDGEVKYETASGAGVKDKNAIAYNLLSTPRGGQYHLVLPDGSKVWLNAESSIKYPTFFAGKQRRVAITGEAYFEVNPVPGNHKSTVPFIVSVLSQTGATMAEVEAIGTEFNINAYVEEDAIKTTLLHGKVKVSVAAVPKQTYNENNRTTLGNNRFRLLMPGQQAQIAVTAAGAPMGDSIKLVDKVDTDVAIAWKNGLHSFKNADIKTIMRMLGRWYNIEIAYEGNIPHYKFTGSIPRNENMPEVLHMLQYAGIHFRVEKEKIIVVP